MSQANIKRLLRSIAPRPAYEAARTMYRNSIPLFLATFSEKLTRPQRPFDSFSPVMTTAGRLWPESPESDYQRGDALHELALELKPSKRQMGYIRYYSRHFDKIRNDIKLMIEIGVQTPNSIMMWERYFPNATIVGIDIDDNCRKFEGGRRLIRIGDQNDEAFLDSIIHEFGGKADIIIDDGEHTPNAILTSFCKLFPALSSHGVYAIEDLMEMPRVTSFFAQLERSINYWPTGGAPEWPYLWQFEDATWLDRNVVSLHFYRCLCLIERGHNPEDNPYLRPKPQ